MHDSQSFHHSDNHFLPHPFLFFVPESKKKFLVFLRFSVLVKQFVNMFSDYFFSMICFYPKG